MRNKNGYHSLPVRFEMAFTKVQIIVTVTLLVTLFVKAKENERKVRARSIFHS